MNNTASQHEDPLVWPRRLARRWRFALATAAPLLIWALWPLAPHAEMSTDAPAVEPPTAAQATSLPRPHVQLAAFDAQLWTLDPPPATPVAPPPPLRLQLVGIVRDGGGESLKAVVYDPDKDELIVVSAGTKLGSRTITAIDPRGVTLSDASGPRRLLMEEGVP